MMRIELRVLALLFAFVSLVGSAFAVGSVIEDEAGGIFGTAAPSPDTVYNPPSGTPPVHPSTTPDKGAIREGLRNARKDGCTLWSACVSDYVQSLLNRSKGSAYGGSSSSSSSNGSANLYGGSGGSGGGSANLYGGSGVPPPGRATRAVNEGHSSFFRTLAKELGGSSGGLGSLAEAMGKDLWTKVANDS
jgi:hypothetical protein